MNETLYYRMVRCDEWTAPCADPSDSLWIELPEFTTYHAAYFQGCRIILHPGRPCLPNNATLITNLGAVDLLEGQCGDGCNLFEPGGCDSLPPGEGEVGCWKIQNFQEFASEATCTHVNNLIVSTGSYTGLPLDAVNNLITGTIDTDCPSGPDLQHAFPSGAFKVDLQPGETLNTYKGRLYYEDLYPSGDNDYDDLVFTFDLVPCNESLLYTLTPCDGGEAIVTDSDLSSVVNKAVDVNGACYTVSAGGMGTPQTVTVTPGSPYNDCADCEGEVPCEYPVEGLPSSMTITGGPITEAPIFGWPTCGEGFESDQSPASWLVSGSGPWSGDGASIRLDNIPALGGCVWIMDIAPFGISTWQGVKASGSSPLGVYTALCPDVMEPSSLTVSQ